MTLLDDSHASNPFGNTGELIPSPDPAGRAAASSPPARLAPHHLADLRASGLSDETIRANDLFTTSDVERIATTFRMKAQVASDLGPCLAIRYYDAAGVYTGYARIKPSNPRPESKGKKGKPGKRKYEAPAGQPNRLYIPAGTRAALADAAVPLFVTEGEKKALKLTQEGFPTVALAGVYAWQNKRPRDKDGKGVGPRELIPDFGAVELKGRTVCVVFDSDAATNENVRWASWHLAEVLTARGANVLAVTLPREPDGSKNGADDYLVRHGPERFRELVAAAAPPTNPSRSGTIVVGTDEHRVNDEAVAAIATDPDVYSRAGQLVRVVPADEQIVSSITYPAGPRIVPLSAATLRERLTRVAKWVKIVHGEEEEQLVPTTPPQPTVLAVLDRRTWPGVRPLVAVVEHPVFLPDGEILSTPGYDQRSGLMYTPRSPIALDVPARPTETDAKRCLAELLDVVREFPFAADHHKSAWLAALLTPLARFAFRGPAPLFLVEGNVPGCGKGLLTDTVSVLVRGANFAITNMPEEGTELRKLATSLLIRGCSMVLFDNVAGKLGGAELDALLTSSVWEDRVLGESRTVELPIYTTWFATGNNVAVVGDTIRRVCPIRLESAEERPEERKVERTDLRGFCAQNRPRLLSAALTLLRAYHVAGRPKKDLPQWGTFEGWSDLVRNAVVWIGLPDPWDGRQAMRDERGDDRIAAFGGLLRLWSAIDTQKTGLTTANIVKRIDSLPEGHELHEILTPLAGSRPDAGMPDSRARSLGYRVREYAGRYVGGHRLVKAGEGDGVRRWRVDEKQKADNPPKSAQPDLPGVVDVADVVDVPNPPREAEKEEVEKYTHEKVVENIDHIGHIDHTGPGLPGLPTLDESMRNYLFH